MKKFRINNLKIRKKLLLIYFFCVLIPIIVTDAIILYTVNQNSRKDKEKEIQFLMDRIAYNMNETVAGCILFTNNLFTDQPLNDFLNRDYENYMSYYHDYMQLLKNNSLSFNYNNGILFKIQVFADNDTILSGGKIGTVSGIQDVVWYQAYKDSGQDIFLYPYYDEKKRYATGSGTSRTISIIRTMDNFGGDNIEKLLKIDINYNIMLMDVLNEKIDADIYVKNQDYILFSNKSGDNGMKEYAMIDSIVEREITMSKTFITGKQEWEIIVLADEEAFWTVILEYKGLVLLILLNIFIPSILIYFVGRSISKRLLIVTSHMDKVKKEHFEEVEALAGEDEIGELIRSYNLMVRKIRNLIEVVFKGKAEKQALELSSKQAELKAIQSQVNPHFLFNTLETIRMRSLIKGEGETADIIGELAIIFRNSMSWGSDFIKIKDEISFIDRYIKIQRYRFGDKIKFHSYIMEGCGEYLVPKLAISTFVENACIHGIETTVNDGIISLMITKNSESLFIEISDNGKGIEENNLEELKEMLSKANTKMLNEAKSTGILNAFLRLRMYFDGNIHFDIDSAPHKGTDISIWIPLISIKKE